MTSHANMKVFYTQPQLPVFQNRMYDTVDEAKACPKGEMRLVQSRETGLIYNALFQPELLKYDDHYQNEQAVSPLFKSHLEAVAQIVERCLGNRSIVEVGCGKGFFLEMLLARGCDVAGFDPTYEGNNPRVSKHYFEAGTGAKATGIVLRHVLEHIQDPYDFLHQLQVANGGTGLIYIEVPCFDWICQHRAWFDVFYEHVNYFRTADFYRMFSRVVEGGHLFGGQYLYIVADLATLRKPEIDSDDLLAFPLDFMRTLNDVSRQVTGPAAIWGGASKGVIFALLMEREGHPIRTVIDINPSKQNKYLPATGIRVQSHSEALASLSKGSTIFVMNSNYLDEIRVMSGNAYNYVGLDNE